MASIVYDGKLISIDPKQVIRLDIPENKILKTDIVITGGAMCVIKGDPRENFGDYSSQLIDMGNFKYYIRIKAGQSLVIQCKDKKWENDSHAPIICAVEDVGISGTWQFNTYLERSDYAISECCTFTSNNKTYQGFFFSSGNDYGDNENLNYSTLYYFSDWSSRKSENVYVFEEEESSTPRWESSYLKRIKFSGTQYVSKDFADWLQRNAMVV